ncbi:hypothetical protein D3C76_466460 [compost metagenome]
MARRQVAEHEGRGDEVGHDVHRHGDDQEGQAAQYQERCAGDGGDDLGRAVDDLAVDLELRAAQHHGDHREHQDVHRQAPEVTDADGLAARRRTREVAEVEHQSAVDRQPQRTARKDVAPHLVAGQGRCHRPGDARVGLEVHEHRQAGHGQQNHRAGKGLVAAHHLHAVGEDHQLHQPDRHEAHPAQARQAKDAVMVVHGQLRPHGRKQHAQHHRGQVGLDTEPGNGDDCADQRRYLRAVDTESDAADDRERYAGLLPHVAGQVHEEVHQRRADAQRQENLPAAQPQGEQPHGEGVVGDVVHIVGP